MDLEALTPTQAIEANARVEEHIRRDFEERLFNQYFISCIGKPREGERFMHLDPDIVDRATFCKRDADGNYDSDTKNSAWWAFRSAAIFYNIWPGGKY